MHTLLALLLAGPAVVESVPFPGSGPAWTDYVLFDEVGQHIWIPAGSRGEAYTYDLKAKKFDTVGGFGTEAGGKRVLGPSSVTASPASIYVGNRAGNKVCAVDRKTLKVGDCFAMPSMPDGIQYVATTKEIWSTTPRSKDLTILSTEGGLKVSGSVPIDGSPEGYAVDPERGLFYTNDEDGDRTYAVDVKTRKVVATYHPNCGKEGPRGLIFEPKHRWMFVACAGGATVLDLGKDGAVLGHASNGGGVDTIDYVPATHRLLLACGKTGKLVSMKVGDKGELSQAAEVPTSDGVRAVVADSAGNAYLPDSKQARMLIVPASKL